MSMCFVQGLTSPEIDELRDSFQSFMPRSPSIRHRSSTRAQSDEGSKWCENYYLIIFQIVPYLFSRWMVYSFYRCLEKILNSIVFQKESTLKSWNHDFKSVLHFQENRLKFGNCAALFNPSQLVDLVLRSADMVTKRFGLCQNPESGFWWNIDIFANKLYKFFSVDSQFSVYPAF